MFDDMQGSQTRAAGDYWEIVRRHRWVILGCAFCCWLLVWGVGWLLPTNWQSDAIIAVPQQQISSALVQPNSTENAEAQLQEIEGQVLNRPRLQNIIDENHLYPKHHGLLALFQPADPVEEMLTKDIQVVPTTVGPKNSEMLTGFTISYTGPTPALAQKVDQDLAHLFVQQNITTQQQVTKNATDFFTTQLDDAQQDLARQEAAVKEFKNQHLGQLPDQLSSNLQILSGLQTELQNNQNALSAAEQQQTYLQSVNEQYTVAQSSLGDGADSAVTPSTLDKQLKDLQMELAQERSEYTDNYPDVIALKEQIEKTKELKKQTEKEIASQQKTDKGADGLPLGATAELQNGAPTPMMQIQSQLKANQVEIKSLQKQQEKIKENIDNVQKRLEATPQVEQELSGIMRGYDESSRNYDALLQKQQDSALAANLQQVQPNLYAIASPPSFPLTPAAPNHLLISLGGLAAGILIGLMVTALIEFTDVRIRKESDLEGVITARVLVGIPNMITPLGNRKRAIHRWIERAAVVAMLVAVIAGNIYAFYRG